MTGETGAGKTMVVSGLGLLLGARADAGLVRAGADSASVEGVVDVARDHPAAVRAAEAGADADDGLVLVRTVSAEGRSRAHVGGRSAPVGVLSEIGEHLVAVHGQADQWRLRQADQHRVLLDQYAGESVGAALGCYQALYDELAAVRRELAELRDASRDRAREVEILQVGLEQIEALDPQPGEDAALRIEDERLEPRRGPEGRRGGGPDPAGGAEEEYAAEPAGNVIAALAAARAALAAMLEHDPALRELDRRLADLGYLAADLGADLRAAYLSDVEVDPARLTWVQQRRADLGGLMRKYGDTVDDVLAWGREAAARLDTLLNADDAVAGLEAREAVLRSDLGAAAAVPRRSAQCRGAGPRCGGELGAGPPRHGQRRRRRRRWVRDPRTTASPFPGPASACATPGTASTRWRSSSPRTRAPLPARWPRRPLAASCRGSCSPSRSSPAPEVRRRSRPSSSTRWTPGWAAGRARHRCRLAALAGHAQVIVVTHLAQVAAFADRHLVVSKSSDGHVTSSGVVRVDEDARLRELARMMAGVDSETASSTPASCWHRRRRGARLLQPGRPGGTTTPHGHAREDRRRPKRRRAASRG